MANLPPPFEFGVDDKYDTWRPRQDEVVTRMVDSDHRLIMPVCPTGFGKSLAYVVGGLINGGKTVILTSTKALQDQLSRDYEGLVVDIRGKNNYPCTMMGGMANADMGPCNWGYKCPFAKSGCPYYEQLRLAVQAPIISTNYAYWMNRRDWGGAGKSDGLGVDTLVCDEAHELPEIISNYLTKEILWTKTDRYGVRNEIIDSYPDLRPGVKEWIDHWHIKVQRKYDDVIWDIKEGGKHDTETIKRAAYFSRLHEATGFIQRLEEEDPENLVTYKTQYKGKPRIVASAVWPYRFTESALLKGVGKVVFTSATVTKKTLGLMGIDGKDVDIVETPHPFPLENRMLVHIPTIRLNYRSTDMELQKWRARIDQIIGSRLDRKGIVHTVSYKRAHNILSNSRFADRMISHHSKNAQQTILGFKEQEDSGVLLSPVVTTGYDFPDDECRYQIIGKIAYPDTTDPVIKKRMQMDRDYASYIAMQRLVQTCGRGVRSVEDWCENFIVDDSIQWFMGKYKDFAPKWFQDSMTRVKVKSRITPLESDVPEPRPLDN